MNDIRLIALDMDGTLVDDRKNISKRNLDALTYAIAAGYIVVPASGRTCCTLPQELLELQGLRYAISCNGAAVTDLTTNRRIYSRNIPKAVLTAILNDAKEYDCVRECAVDDVLYVEAADDEKELTFVSPHHYDFMRAMRTVTPSIDLIAAGAEDGAQKILIFFTRDSDNEQFSKYLRDNYDVTLSSSLKSNLEITAPGVSKGSALQWLANRLHIPAEQAMAFGDAENDLEMLQWAGRGIAMGNAISPVKAVADEITSGNDDDGVALILEHLFGIAACQ